MSERLTEKLVRDLLAKNDYLETSGVIVEEQKSANIENQYPACRGSDQKFGR